MHFNIEKNLDTSSNAWWQNMLSDLKFLKIKWK